MTNRLHHVKTVVPTRSSVSVDSGDTHNRPEKNRALSFAGCERSSWTAVASRMQTSSQELASGSN